jgi:hypothetical protein
MIALSCNNLIIIKYDAAKINGDENRWDTITCCKTIIAFTYDEPWV